jgi:prevent-host-death family protein
MMKEVNIKEARKNISRLLDEVQAGEEVIISRRGMPVARLVAAGAQDRKELRFPDRRDFRAKLPPARQSSASLIRELRDERG